MKIWDVERQTVLPEPGCRSFRPVKSYSIAVCQQITSKGEIWGGDSLKSHTIVIRIPGKPGKKVYIEVRSWVATAPLPRVMKHGTLRRTANRQPFHKRRPPPPTSAAGPCAGGGCRALSSPSRDGCEDEMVTMKATGIATMILASLLLLAAPAAAEVGAVVVQGG